MYQFIEEQSIGVYRKQYNEEVKMDNIAIILSAIFVPACVLLVFSAIQKTNSGNDKGISNDYFTVMLPKIVLYIGIAADVVFGLVLLLFTFFSEELPHVIFYIVFGLFFWLGMYLILKTIRFRVIVRGEKITVFSILRKPYSFTFDQVVSAVRQVKNNQVNSERIVVKTTAGRKLIVESSEISYERFAKKIRSTVTAERLSGF